MRDKELILNELDESMKDGKTLFRIIAPMNNRPISIFQWCNDEWNFIGMTTFKDLKVTYSKEELRDDIIDNALTWLDGIKEHNWKENISAYLLAI